MTGDKVRYTVEIKWPELGNWRKVAEYQCEYDAEYHADNKMNHYRKPNSVRVVMHSEVVLYHDGVSQQ